MFDFKNLKGIIFVLLVILAFIFGTNSPINISAFIWKFPIFQSMSKLDKYYSFFVAFLLCLAAGLFVNLMQRKYQKIFIYLVIPIIILNSYDEFKTNIEYHMKLFSHFTTNPSLLKSTPEIDENKDFTQVEIINDSDIVAYLQYKLFMKNIGLIKNWSGELAIKEYAIPKYFINIKEEEIPLPLEISLNPEYRGELFFANSNENNAKFNRFTPNIIELTVNCKRPDILVINQNYHRYWKEREGKLISWNGLLGIKIDKPGIHNLKLMYLPTGFFIGGLISLVFFIISVLMLVVF
jgi:hypothetical protein